MLIQFTNDANDGGYLVPDDSPLANLILFGGAYRYGDEWLDPKHVRVTLAGYEYRLPSYGVVSLAPTDVTHFVMDAKGVVGVREHSESVRLLKA